MTLSLSPGRFNRAGSSSSCLTLSDIEEEERRLLRLKRKADERRRKEDEELERRLHELQQKKRGENRFQGQAAPHYTEIEGQRRRLEEMRQTLGSDRSFFSTSHDSSIENDSPNTSADLPDIFALSNGGRPISAPKSNTIEKMENNGNNNSPSAPHKKHAKKRSGSWGDLPNSDTQVTTGNGRAFSQRLEKMSGPGDSSGLTLTEATDHGSTNRDDKTRLGSFSDLDGQLRLGINVSDQVNRDRRSTIDSKLSDFEDNMDRLVNYSLHKNKEICLMFVFTISIKGFI